MKTNPAARKLVRIRFIILGTVMAALVGLAGYEGASLAARLGQIPQYVTASPAAPNVDLGDLMAATR
jgi:hypothetical protein